jgi:hypothetical protein
MVSGHTFKDLIRLVTITHTQKLVQQKTAQRLNMKTNMHNWEIAEIVYALRLLAENLDKKPRTTQEQEILEIAYEALLVAPREIHELVNILESNDNYE